ncbi:hypothetical protein KK062_18985 [Fulvivirgaceae bacterium PWU5]|uniref:IPT/TIG domain-containing protein n=1 Tax=Dawidia cretensis TaxID=2782350 RepID=A0AAP2GVE1_9BACT|nr:hypothetical protein [Dawidia cretensis]MBT1710340.1 hypothetical protein [Dawidia cretensis]
MKKIYYPWLLALLVAFSCSDEADPNEDENGCNTSTITLTLENTWAYTGQTLTLKGEHICKGGLTSVTVNGTAASTSGVTESNILFTIPEITGDSATVVVTFGDFSITVGKIAIFPGNGTWAEVASFPGTGRVDARAFTVEHKVYVVRGNQLSVTYDPKNYDDVHSFDPATGTWTALSPQDKLNQIQFETAPAKNGLIFLDQPTQELYYYNPLGNTFNAIERPTLRSFNYGFMIDGETYYAQAAINGNYLYIIKYNEAGDTWELVHYSMYAEDEYFYFMGGFEADGKAYLAIKRGDKYDEIQMISFDPATKTIENLPALSLAGAPSQELSYLFTIGKLGYFLERGSAHTDSQTSWVDTPPSNRLYIFNTVAKQWHTTTPPHPGMPWSGTSFTVDGRGFLGLGAVQASRITYPQKFYEFIPR